MSGLRIGLVLALAACRTAGIQSLRDPHENQLAITVHNESGAPLCEVHIFLIHSTDHGHNWLQEQREIPTRTSREFWVPKEDPARTYQVDLGGCSGAKTVVGGYAPSIHMNGPAHAVLFDEGTPASKDAAQGIAHANENATLIPAKFSRGRR